MFLTVDDIKQAAREVADNTNICWEILDVDPQKMQDMEHQLQPYNHTKPFPAEEDFTRAMELYATLPDEQISSEIKMRLVDVVEQMRSYYVLQDIAQRFFLIKSITEPKEK